MGIAQAAALCVVGYVIAAYWVPFLFGLFVVTILPVAALILAAAVADASGRPTLLSGRRMQFLGEISFGFFICQGVVIFYGRRLINHDAGFSTPIALLVMGGFFLATLLGGWLLFTFVETPMMRRFSRPRRRPVPSVPATSVTVPVSGGAIAEGPVGDGPAGEVPVIAGSTAGTSTGVGDAPVATGPRPDPDPDPGPG